MVWYTEHCIRTHTNIGNDEVHFIPQRMWSMSICIHVDGNHQVTFANQLHIILVIACGGQQQSSQSVTHSAAHQHPYAHLAPNAPYSEDRIQRRFYESWFEVPALAP